MSNILLLSIYVDKNRKMIFVPCKKTKAGFRRASEPYVFYDAEEVNNVDKHIKNAMEEIALNPIAEDNPGKPSVMKRICGKKSYTQFTKEHINIDVSFDVKENVFTISNVPRLADGSYGIRKNTLSQQYSSNYECNGNDNDKIRKNFLKAYAEAQRYLYAIGELKEPNIDFDFGHKTTWIAIKDVSLNFIIDNNKIAKVEQMSWEKGLYTVENDNKKVFISGPYDGWTIILGKSLPDPSKPQEVVNLLKELSCGIKEVCYFSSHETVGLYGFARMLKGEIDRMYGYLGESGHVYVNIGKKSQAEEELSLNFADNDEAFSVQEFDDISKEDILKIATKWCIKPENFLGTKRSCYVADFFAAQENA